jgi:hypothetical protein
MALASLKISRQMALFVCFIIIIICLVWLNRTPGCAWGPATAATVGGPSVTSCPPPSPSSPPLRPCIGVDLATAAGAPPPAAAALDGGRGRLRATTSTTFSLFCNKQTNNYIIIFLVDPKMSLKMCPSKRTPFIYSTVKKN